MHRMSLGVLCSVGLASTLLLAACGSAAPANTSSTSGATTGTTTSTTTTTTAAAGGTGSSTTCKAGSALKVDGGFTMVCLPYNEQEFGVTGQPTTPPAFDQGGYTLDPTDPAFGKANSEQTVSSVKFWFPDTGGGTKVVKSGINFGPVEGGSVTVTVPSGKYKNLELLAGAGNGPGTADITFNYSDGSKDTATTSIDDWCSSTPTGLPGLLPADRYDATGTSASPACGLFVYTVPIPGTTKTLSNVAFVNDSANGTNFEPEVIALSLQGA